MREIKFRAFYNGKMCKVLELIFLEKKTDILLEDSKGNQIREWLKNLDLMQYTGLKDKNVKEIYEGDIIKLDKDENYQVKFGSWEEDDSRGYGFYLNRKRSYEMHEDDKSDYEVIGNVYENPELLKDA